jgi:hypothetical protein
VVLKRGRPAVIDLSVVERWRVAAELGAVVAVDQAECVAPRALLDPAAIDQPGEGVR